MAVISSIAFLTSKDGFFSLAMASRFPQTQCQRSQIPPQISQRRKLAQVKDFLARSESIGNDDPRAFR